MIYIFQNPETHETIEINQSMKDEHSYVDDNGLKWRRVFTVPQMSVSTRIDPFSQEQFVRSSTDKKTTVGCDWDKSLEMSQKRAEQNGGVDPVREKALADYSKERKGAKHPSELPKTFSNKHVTVEY